MLYHQRNSSVDHKHHSSSLVEESSSDEDEEQKHRSSDSDTDDPVVNPFNVQDPNVLHERDYDPQSAVQRYEEVIDQGDRADEEPWWLRRVSWLNPPSCLLTAKSKESFWDLSSTCLSRTKMYHAMLHYKLRLMLSVRVIRNSMNMLSAVVLLLIVLTGEEEIGLLPW